MPRLLAPLIATTVLLVAAPAATAGQILFAHNTGNEGADIWIMDDDGSDARPFITRSQIPDGAATTLSDPAVDESSGAVLFNGFVGTFGGTNGLAVYKLQDGVITRLSRAGTQSGEGTTADAEPEPFGNGSFIFRGQSCTGTTCNVTVFETQSMSDTAADGNLETRANWGTACDGSGALTHPMPNPVNPAQVAYAGCTNPDTFETQRLLIVSGAARAGEKRIAFDDEPQEQPTWRPDGGQIAAIERSNNAGIHVYDPNDDTQDKRRVVAVESFDSTLNNLTYMGNDSIVFDRAIGSEKKIVKIAASCADCSPDSATVVKADAGKDSFDPEWTPRASLPGVGGSSGPGPGPTPPGPAAPGPAPDPIARFAKTQKLSRGHVRVEAGCEQACQYTTRGSSIKAGAKKRALKTVARTFTAGETATLKLKLSKATIKAARKALRARKKVTVELVLSAYYAGDKIGGPLIRKVRLK